MSSGQEVGLIPKTIGGHFEKGAWIEHVHQVAISPVLSHTFHYPDIPTQIQVLQDKVDSLQRKQAEILMRVDELEFQSRWKR
jgi:hypothetical protein